MARMPRACASFAASIASTDRGVLSGSLWTWMSIVPASARAEPSPRPGCPAPARLDPPTGAMTASINRTNPIDAPERLFGTVLLRDGLDGVADFESRTGHHGCHGRLVVHFLDANDTHRGRHPPDHLAGRRVLDFAPDA